MDSSKKYNNPSPELKANIVSKLFFCWVLPFFKYGYQNDLQIKDIYNCTESDYSSNLGTVLEKYWMEEVENKLKQKQRPSLLSAIRKAFLVKYGVFGVLLLFQSIVLKMLQPVAVAAFIKYFDDKNRTPEQGWLLAFAVIFLAFVNIVISHHTSLGCQRVGMRCRIACCSLIYRKLLRLNRTSLGETAVGQLVNLLSNDVNRFDFASNFLHYVWIMPIQLCVAAYVMWNFVGVAAVSGLLAITLQAVPLQGYLSKMQGVLRGKIARKTDARVKLMNEITSGIQVIKMYAWEKPFEKIVELARKYEIKVVSKTSYIKGFSLALMVFTERTTLYLTMVTYVLIGNTLTSDIVFSIAQLFNTIQLYMSILFPLGMASYAEAKTSIVRIEDFLLKEENAAIEDTRIKTNTPAIKTNTGAIKLTCVNATWIPNAIVHTLMDVNLDIKPGALCCVVGPVGAGKSSLLQLLLKELPLRNGKLTVDGALSYSSQEPWLFVSTVQNNILFGQTYVKERYKRVVKVCALERDLEELPHGDKTPVGERGVSLSGGQRARINLARAVYREADIYLFDDPLSAVDPHVSKHLFNECIVGYLGEKTRILVTHQLQFLKQADLIVVIKNGKIHKAGGYESLSEQDLKDLQQEAHAEETAEDAKSPEKEKRERLMSVSSFASNSVDEEENEPQETHELMEKGALSSSIYKQYFRAGASIPVLVFLVLLLIVAQMACNAGDLWLTAWTNAETSGTLALKSNNALVDTTIVTTPINNDTLNDILTTLDTLDVDNMTALDADNDTYLATTLPTDLQTDDLSNSTTLHEMIKYYTRNTYIWIYTIFIILSIILTTLRSLLFYKVCMNASKNLHNLMFSNVLQATMRFFDTNPSGRILNRFSKDMGAIDEQLPLALLQSIQVFLVMSGILVMNYIVSPWMILATVILGAIFLWFRNVFISGAQDVKRLEGITRAPVFSYVSASLNGLPTIRSCNAQEMVIKEFDVLQDQHTGSWFLFLASYETFGFYLDVISLVFYVLVTCQFLIFDSENSRSADIGLVISQSLILLGMLQHGIRQTAEVSSNMTSVERVLQYTKLDKEGPFESLPTRKPPRDWPKSGRVVFRDLYLRYIPEDEPVLKQLNFSIEPAEKVGIVGRTGAGKSSIISALFRLAPTDGEILIDDVDTKSIGLNDLRSNISIIPQEPVLFSASVRYNLDPFQKVDDATLWKALESVELKTTIDSLDQRVSEGGSNFSVGQRQLMCLARAIVRNNKVLVMDEATANVDPQTDALIQSSIRRNFKDCTVLTIAHRLNTIMDSDKVLVMDAGQVKEFDHPHRLLEDSDSYLSGMVKETGSVMESKLRKVAEESYKIKFPARSDN